jgi:hypothetical protein
LRQWKRLNDLGRERRGRLPLPDYPFGTQARLRCDTDSYPMRVVKHQPGRLTVVYNDDTDDSPCRRIFTYRLLRKRPRGWFGVWVEKGYSCRWWMRMRKSFDVRL